MVRHNPGCRCVNCAQGLLQLAVTHCHTADDYRALAELDRRLKAPVDSPALTLVGQPVKRCDASMTCDCPACTTVKAKRRGGSVRQPWQPKAA